MKLSDFYYELPSELIARYPLKDRSASRLLCLNNTFLEHRQFVDLISLINCNDLLVCNNSKVIPARLLGQKETGGKVEILIERILDDHRALVHLRASKSPKANQKIIIKEIAFKVLGRSNDLFELLCEDARPILKIIEEIGEVPLPPYFKRKPEDEDAQRYQTVYAKHQGSVAAPTAGLHFDEMMLKKLQEKGVEIAYLTLHVGSGTFIPVRTEKIEQHLMHKEYLEVTESLCEQVRKTRARDGRVIAVGTTTVRGLETASQTGEIKPYAGDTSIFIYPGYSFRTVDAMITNFHLPESTLLMLVSAFAGREKVLHAYQEAINRQYRFYSYGDAMFLVKS